MQMGKNAIFLTMAFKLEIVDTHINQFLILLKGYREEDKLNHKYSEPENSLTWVDLVH